MINHQVVPEHKKNYHYETGESHKFLGKYYTLLVQHTNQEPQVRIQGENLILECNNPNSRSQKEMTLDMWYREKAKETFIPIVADAVVKSRSYCHDIPIVRIYRMLDRWGSCSPKTKILIMNLELIKVPTKCIEYIALHEMLHFRYPSHDFAFFAALGNLMPDWKKREDFLNEWYPI